MYELSAHRYRELKHFCLQYNEMKELLLSLDGKEVKKGEDPTGKTAALRRDLTYALNLIEKTAFETGKIPGGVILEIVTNDLSLSRAWYDRNEIDFYVRKFFWLLSERKGV